MSFFSARTLSAGYGKRRVLHDVSFDLCAGSLTGILGANGSGKSTLLKAICGILPHEGSCLLEGDALESLSPRKLAQNCSYIPQRSGITIDLSALDVALMGFNPQLGLLEQPDASMKKSASEALALVGLDGMQQQNYMTLSEGQKQLCILARTLCTQSKMMILDEPESALDFRHRHRMLTIIRDWTQDKARAALLALHDPTLALNCCDTLLLLDGGTIIGTLHPASDPLQEMAEKLSAVYGSVSLHRCADHLGCMHLLMLKEED